MKSIVLVLALGLVLMAGVWATGGAQSALPGEGKTFVLGYGMWSADNPSLHVTKVLLEDELGYDVEIAELSTQALYPSIASGQVHAFTHAWFPNQQYLVDRYKNDLEIVGLHYDDSFTATIIPTWVAEEYDIKDMDDLFRPEIVKLFDRDGDGKGDILGCDIAWTCNQIFEDKLEYSGLDEYYVQLPIAEQMSNFEIRRAMQTRQPIIFLNWTPGWIFSQFPVPEKLTLLEDPSGYHPDGGDIDQYGWPPGIAKTAVGLDVKKDHPEAYALLKEISVPLQAVNDSVYLQVVEGEGSREDLDRHAREWIEANRETVDGWLEAAGLK